MKTHINFVPDVPADGNWVIILLHILWDKVRSLIILAFCLLILFQ